MGTSQQSTSTAFERENINIPSVTPGWSLDAWKYMPRVQSKQQSPKGLPVIIMAHGASGNKLLGLAPYAETFSSLGYAVVVFDYRRWGASAGIPRHIIYVSEQLDDYRSVIKYCRQQPEFDPHRVVLWGTSFSGGHVVTLASERKLNISCVIAQCPYLGSGPPTTFSWTLVKTLWKCVTDVLRQMFGLYPSYIPAVAHPGEVALIAVPGSKDGYFALGDAERDFPNEVSASSLLELPFYSPNASGANITCPALVVAPMHDNICMFKAATELQSLSDKIQLLALSAGHFDVYPGCPLHEESLNAMKAFLSEHVPSV
ncbi:alpha/beta-hydrolase [Lenzites betulinus]|nr:alpha/beta-hydrolase [Lenzites betulinus]